MLAQRLFRCWHYSPDTPTETEKIKFGECVLCVFQDEATELVIFVLHSLKNQRESHMMGESCDAEVEQDISRVRCWLQLSDVCD